MKVRRPWSTVAWGTFAFLNRSRSSWTCGNNGPKYGRFGERSRSSTPREGVGHENTTDTAIAVRRTGALVVVFRAAQALPPSLSSKGMECLCPSCPRVHGA